MTDLIAVLDDADGRIQSARLFAHEGRRFDLRRLIESSAARVVQPHRARPQCRHCHLYPPARK